MDANHQAKVSSSRIASIERDERPLLKRRRTGHHESIAITAGGIPHLERNNDAAMKHSRHRQQRHRCQQQVPDHADHERLLRQLRQNDTNVRSLRWPCTWTDIDGLISCLDSNNNLAEIDMSFNECGEAAASAAIAMLERTSPLLLLDLSGNMMKRQTMQRLVKILATKKHSLQSLRLSQTAGIASMPEQLSDALMHSDISHLDISSNFLGAHGTMFFARMLAANTSLRSLDISCNFGHPLGAQLIADALRTNFVLTTLNLRYNLVKACGVSAIARALRGNQTLKWIDLSCNMAGPTGIKAVAEMLSINTRLTYMDLSYNLAGRPGLQAIAIALRRNTTLEQLKLDYNNGDVEGFAAIAVSLRINPNSALQLLSMHSDDVLVNDSCATAFASMIEVNTSLRSLSLMGQHNALSIIRLAGSLQRNNTLEYLDLRCTSSRTAPRSKELQSAIACLMRGNRTLIRLRGFDHVCADQLANNRARVIQEVRLALLAAISARVDGSIAVVNNPLFEPKLLDIIFAMASADGSYSSGIIEGDIR